jgi:Ca-activated chloride channel family protein
MRRSPLFRQILGTLLLAAPLTVPGCNKKQDAGRTDSHEVADPATSKPADPAAEAAPPASPVSPAPVGAAGGAIHQAEARNTESYARMDPNPWTRTAEDRLSTFAIDVDTGSYTVFRKKVLAGQPIPPESVRVEEFVNYFRYTDAQPEGGQPFAIHSEMAPSPWRSGAHLLRVALEGHDVPPAARKRAHLVFLVDVSGSMGSPDKLPLVKKSLRILVESLTEGDTVSLVTYAGSTRVVLEPTGLEQRTAILEAINDLDAQGSTAMASGLDLAYQQATRKLSRDSVSRVIVLTDGDANVGPSSFEEILSIISDRVKEGVTLSTIGFGMGNYKDSLLEQLADKGDGNYFYVDSPAQARRVFHEQLGGTLEVIARDVKVQVEFDPKAVSRYRLVGYENRDVADAQFRNDKVDGGEIGSGHAVTAFYEIELAKDAAGEIGLVQVRAKKPEGGQSAEWSQPVAAGAKKSFDAASADFRFGAAVMAAAEILRRSPEAAGWKLADARAVAHAAAGDMAERLELVALLDRLVGEATAASATLAR